MNLHEFLANLPKIGEKVRFVKTPERHWFKDVIDNCMFLEIGKEYTVYTCDPVSSWTPIVLEEFPGKTFCLSSFEKV